MPMSDILIAYQACPVISKAPQETAPDQPILYSSAGMPHGRSGRTERRLHVRVLGTGQSRLVTRWAACSMHRVGWRAGHDPAAWRRSGHHRDMETAGHAEFGICSAVDVHYPGTGGARAAAVMAADAAFAHVLAERTAVVPPRTALSARTVLPARAPAAARGPGRPERAGPAGRRWLRRPGSRRPARPGRS